MGGYAVKRLYDAACHGPHPVNAGIAFPSGTWRPRRDRALKPGRDEARHGKGFEGLLKRYFGK